MYSFEPSDEQKMLVDAIGRFARNDMRPSAREADEAASLPAPLIEKGWQLGVLQGSILEEFGGFGTRSAVTGALAMEELAYGDLAGAFAISSPTLFALPILLAGSDAQKARYLPEAVSGAWPPRTAALIEYRYDFDPQNLKTCAEKDGDGFRLAGEKAFVPYASQAESLLVYAELGGQTQGFIVPRTAAGLSISTEREMLMGVNALPLYRVTLDGVTVDAQARLGGPSGHTFEPLLASMRVAHAAAALGVARAAFEYARDYAKEREAFGVKIAQKQAVAFMLAEMCTELEATRLLTWEAAWKIDTEAGDAATDAYFASLSATDMVMMVTDRAVQILGGHGYIRDHPVEMWMRNGRGFAALTGLAIV